MGWFWADAPAKPAPAVVAPHPMPPPGATPPPACPMHKSSSSTSPLFPSQADKSTPSNSSACPVKSPNHPLRNPSRPDQASQTIPETSIPQKSSSTLSKLNPLNYMPTLANEKTSDTQAFSLPLEREESTIPRGDSESNWEYPSPQQMYNALLRKPGPAPDPTAIESMVAIHNFLNEGAWSEIKEWERIFSPGLVHAWSLCAQGEQGIAMSRARQEFESARREALGLPPLAAQEEPKLVRFQGRPQEPTPKARILTTLGWVFPETFGAEPPFDRHDWYVQRRRPDGTTKEVRYVIDYYSGGVQESGEPVFYLDIRPALDTPTAAVERAMRWGGDVWSRASGSAVREKERLEKDRDSS